MIVPSVRPFRTRLLVLAIVCLAVYVNTFTGQPVWDDLTLLTEDHHIREYTNIPFFFTPAYWNESHPFPGCYRPFRAVSLALDYFFWGSNLTGYHLTNVLLHAGNVILVFFVVFILFERPAARPPDNPSRRVRPACLAFLTALFFAVHPVHTESVNLIKNRSDLLAFLFFLLSFLLFVRHHAASGRMTRWLRIFGAWVFFVSALLSKEMALTLPGVLALYVICFFPARERRGGLMLLVPFGVIVVLYFWFTGAMIVPAEPFLADMLEPAGPVRHTLAVVKTIGIYLKLLLVPFPLTLDHGFTVPESAFQPAVLFSLAAIALVLFVAIRFFRRSRVAFFAVGWVVLTLTPAVNIVYLSTRPIAEQRLYIPSFGFCLLLAYGIEYLSRIRPKRLVPERMVMLCGLTAGAVACLYAGMTLYRNVDWRDPVRLYTKAVDANPRNLKMLNNLGAALCEQGDVQSSINCLRKALQLKPDYVSGRFNLGFALYQAGRFGEAVDHYRIVLEARPDDPDVLFNMGLALYAADRYPEAVTCFASVLESEPGNATAHGNLGLSLAAVGRSAAAIEHLRKAVSLKPDCPEFQINLGAVLAETGCIEAAVRHLSRAVRLQPDSVSALNNLGLALVAAGRVEEAIGYHRRALKYMPDNADTCYYLGMAFLDRGKVVEAGKYFRRSLTLCPTHGDARRALDGCRDRPGRGS